MMEHLRTFGQFERLMNAMVRLHLGNLPWLHRDEAEARRAHKMIEAPPRAGAFVIAQEKTGRDVPWRDPSASHEESNGELRATHEALARGGHSPHPSPAIPGIVKQPRKGIVNRPLRCFSYCVILNTTPGVSVSEPAS
jgi:hypothetical protein